MSWMATERYGARAAPAGLALVQELVNTHAFGRGDEADLLADRETAQRWLRGAAGQWASLNGLEPPELSLSSADLRALRELRAVVRELLAAPPGERAAERSAGQSGGANAAGVITQRAQALLVSGERGRVALVPSGTGSGWLASAVWSEILFAQRGGAWSRVKLCRAPGCHSAFYDASRNGSGTWHNVRTCGNITNLRASRARKKAAARPRH